MNTRLLILGLILIGLGIAAVTSLFVVSESQQALVLRFGEFQREINQPSADPQPGLHVKLPWESTVFYDKRALNLDARSEEIVLRGQQRLVVDAFARWRIVNPRLFFATVGNEAVAENRLNTFLIAATRNILAEASQADVLSERRVALMDRITTQVRERAADIGVEVIDVRLRAADLPPQIQENVFRRMRSQRQQEATRIRGEGEEQFRRIVAEADRTVVELTSEAEREAQQIRGQADNEAIQIYASAFNRDAEFYAFYRSLQAYRESLGGEGTTLLLSPNSQFFRFFEELPTGE